MTPEQMEAHYKQLIEERVRTTLSPQRLEQLFAYVAKTWLDELLRPGTALAAQTIDTLKNETKNSARVFVEKHAPDALREAAEKAVKAASNIPQLVADEVKRAASGAIGPQIAQRVRIFFEAVDAVIKGGTP